MLMIGPGDIRLEEESQAFEDGRQPACKDEPDDQCQQRRQTQSQIEQPECPLLRIRPEEARYHQEWQQAGKQEQMR